MTLATEVSNPIQILTILPREYEVFGGLDVDHHSIAITFTDHQKLMPRLWHELRVSQRLRTTLRPK